jgi:hypothetical protein
MTKCYPIGDDLQTTPSTGYASSMPQLTTEPIVRHNSRSAPIECSLYVFHMSSGTLDHKDVPPHRLDHKRVPPHDEFNGMRKVSLVDRTG